MPHHLSRKPTRDSVRSLQIGNPAPLGLFAFGLTTALLQVPGPGS